MQRRLFLSGVIATSIAPMALAQQTTAEISEIEKRIKARRTAGKPITSSWIIEQLRPRSELEMRIGVFELVRRVPYRLSRWTGDPDSLFQTGAGDCRHKEAAERQLFRTMGVQGQHVRVLFDWADLPIPRDIVALLTDSRGIHDTFEAVIDGKNVIVDATWDPPLKAVGFPVLPSWDGISQTPAITTGSTTVIRPGDVSQDTNLYDYFGLPYPKKERTLAFNRALNKWADGVRADQA